MVIFKRFLLIQSCHRTFYQFQGALLFLSFCVPEEAVTSYIQQPSDPRTTPPQGRRLPSPAIRTTLRLPCSVPGRSDLSLPFTCLPF